MNTVLSAAEARGRNVMASIPVSVGEEMKGGSPREGDGAAENFIRVIVADTQAIFRAGLRKKTKDVCDQQVNAQQGFCH